MSSQTVKKLNSQVSESPNVNTPPAVNRRILVVDDEQEIAKGIQNLLSPPASNVLAFPASSRSATKTPAPAASVPAGFEVVVCHNPHTTLQAVEEACREGKPFAMGFFDVMLGADIDGIELVKRVFALDSQISAVFVTAYNDRNVDSINQYLDEKNADRWDYINKPFTDGEIIQKARNVTAVWNLKNLKAWQETQLQEAQKVLLQNERSNTVAAVGRSVAHEFGNLLTQIVGHAELSLLKNDQARMREGLETILKAADTATSVLDRFKKLAQGEDAKQYGLIQIASPIEEAIELMGYQFKKHEITVNKNPFEVALLEANKHSLVQVFMNLFINAVHVMEEGGSIDISVMKKDDRHLEIKVRDHGPGIPESILPKVTEALFTTKGSQGSGLGLAICKEIIEIEHSGELTVSNHPQGGAQITMIIPTRQDEDA